MSRVDSFVQPAPRASLPVARFDGGGGIHWAKPRKGLKFGTRRRSWIR